jgi:hypothetical protein
MYAKARAAGQRGVSMTKVLTVFMGLGALAGTATCLVAGKVAQVIGGERIDLGIALPLAVAGAVVVQAAAVPLAMALMDPIGLRLTARLSLVAVPLNIVGAILVAPHLGAPGPLYVGIVVAGLVQTIPAAVHLRRRNAKLPPSAPAAPDAEEMVELGAEIAVPRPQVPLVPSREWRRRPSPGSW